MKRSGSVSVICSLLLALHLLTPYKCKVKVVGKQITRDALVNNELVVVATVNRVGSRVSLQVLNVHIQAVHELMEIPLDGPLVIIRHERYHWT